MNCSANQRKQQLLQPALQIFTALLSFLMKTEPHAKDPGSLATGVEGAAAAAEKKGRGLYILLDRHINDHLRQPGGVGVIFSILGRVIFSILGRSVWLWVC